MRAIKYLCISVIISGGLVSSAFAQYYSGYTATSYGSICTQEAYTCSDGTMVGRSGPNCQFVCPNTTTQSSYTYTDGCYIYYYNGYTRQSSLVGSNCSNTYGNNYGNNYSYSQPYSYTQPVTQTYYTQPTTQTYYTQPTTQTYYTQPTYTYTQPTTQTYYSSPSSYSYPYNYSSSYYPSSLYYTPSASYNSVYNNSNYNNSGGFLYINGYGIGGCYYENGFQICI